MHHTTISHHVRRLAAAMLLVSASGATFVVADATTAAAARRVPCIIAVNNDTYETPQDTPLAVSPIGVVANDNICGTDGLVISLTSPSHGTLTGFDDSDGGFTYVPDAGYTGTDSFTYTLEDVEGAPSATVTITIAPAATTTTPTTSTPATSAPTTTSVAPTTTAVAPAAAAVTATPTFTG